MSVDADNRVGADLGGIAPEIGARILAFAAAVHAGPGAEGAGTNDGSAVRCLKSEGCVGRMREAGEAGQRFGSDEFSFASELHAADDGGEVHVAAALAGSEKRALHLDCAGKNRGTAIGDAETAIGVTMKSEFGFGIVA